MGNIDDIALKINIERRIGKATSYTRLTSVNTPFKQILNAAEDRLNSKVDLFVVDGGVPENGYLSGFNNHVILFSKRYLELSLLLWDMIVDESQAYHRLEFANKICLRVMAELSLRYGIEDWTTPALLRSMTGLNTYIPHTYATVSSAKENMVGEEFITTCFFSLAHELGHGFVAETTNLATEFISNAIIYETLADALASFVDCPHTLKDEALNVSTEHINRSPVGLNHLRQEVLADRFAVEILLHSTLDYQINQGKRLNIERFIESVIIVFNTFVLIERCKRTVLTHKSKDREAVKHATLLLPVAFKVRAILWSTHLANLLAELLSHGEQEISEWRHAIVTSMSEISTNLEDTLDEFESGLARAMRFVFFPNERDQRVVSDHKTKFEDVALAEGRRFVNLARGFQAPSDFIAELEGILST